MRASKLFVLTFLFFFISSKSFSQVDISTLGAETGMGVFNGNSPQVFSYNVSLFSDILVNFSSPSLLRVKLFYSGDFNSIVPQNRQHLYSSNIRGGSLQLLLEQSLYKQLYLQEGFGPLFVNDRTFSDVNTWNYGAVFSISCGIKFFNSDAKGFSLSINAELGNTFTSTTPQYLNVCLQPKFSF